ncbi:MAG: hypothetical protein JNM59_03455 [Hyphomonadaceae bacterium]|nr:hypothetical protein [Hyphomonadaceae bacterium]
MRFIAMASALAAGAITALTALALGAPTLAFPLNMLMGLAQATAYAAFLGLALVSSDHARARFLQDGLRTWAAMAIIAFLMFILLFVMSLPIVGVLLAGPMAPYVEDLQRAGQDQAAVMAIMTRFAEANPGMLLGIVLFFGAITLFVTSRFFVAAPATLAARRILTFETWRWTKAATLSIVGARLMLLAPANVFAGALGYVIGRLMGVDAMAPATGQTAAPFFLVYVFASAFLSLMIYYALEAGLSAAFYRRLRPPAA